MSGVSRSLSQSGVSQSVRSQSVSQSGRSSVGIRSRVSQWGRSSVGVRSIGQSDGQSVRLVGRSVSVRSVSQSVGVSRIFCINLNTLLSAIYCRLLFPLQKTVVLQGKIKKSMYPSAPDSSFFEHPPIRNRPKKSVFIPIWHAYRT